MRISSITLLETRRGVMGQFWPSGLDIPSCSGDQDLEVVAVMLEAYTRVSSTSMNELYSHAPLILEEARDRSMVRPYVSAPSRSGSRSRRTHRLPRPRPRPQYPLRGARF